MSYYRKSVKQMKFDCPVCGTKLDSDPETGNTNDYGIEWHKRACGNEQLDETDGYY